MEDAVGTRRLDRSSLRRKPERFDVVIVGARCAGSTLATLLARRGLNVCVLDRARFPSEILSTHVIWPSGVAILDRVGVRERVAAAGPIPLTRCTFVLEDARIDADLSGGPGEGRGPGLCVRRVVLDNLLVESAAQAGADVRLRTRVSGLIHERGRVVGVETERGPLRAPLVVGADGPRSTVAAAVGAAEYHVVSPTRICTWAYFEDVADTEGRLRVVRLGEWVFLASPADSGLYMVSVCPPLSSRRTFLADRCGSFMAALPVWPELADLTAGARRVGAIRVMANWHGYFREAAGPGWVLLGDAGQVKDPTAAQGMSDAFRQAEQLADVVETGLGGPGSIDHALTRWWTRRDRDLDEMHWFAADLGQAGPPPRVALELVRDVAASGESREQLMQVLNHDLRPSELFNHAAVKRALARVARDRPEELPKMMRELTTAVGTFAHRARQRHDPLAGDSTIAAYG
jgi:2-polyprenyl-6-methoxyphenol hydroxylase-like FAD-dependent oxidoreductase